MAWLLRATPYDPDISAERTVYFSDIGLMTTPSDTPADTYWDRRLDTPFQVRTTLYAGSSVGGRSDASFGNITLENADGNLDYLAGYDWDGRLVEVRWTSVANPVLADFEVVFSGTAERLILGDTLEIELRDLAVLLDKPYQPAKYLGTGTDDGGEEGPPSYKDRRKPLLVGVCRQFSPVPLQFKKHIYAYGTGQSGNILAVKDNGFTLTAGMDYANYSLLDAAVVPQGTYASCKAQSLIKMGGLPAGVVTMDAEGVAPSGTALKTFADIAHWVIDTSTDLGSSDFASGTVAAMNSLCPQTLGFWFDGSGGETVQNVLDFLASSIGATYGFNDERKIVFGRLDEPKEVADFEFTDRDLFRIVPLAVAKRLKSQNVKYRRYWRPLSQSEVVGTITGTAKEDLTRQWREVTRDDAAVAASSLLSREEKLETALDLESEAAAEAQRRIDLFGARRRAFAATVPFTPGLTAGMTVRISSSKSGLSSGANFVVIMADRDSITETHDIEVWG